MVTRLSRIEMVSNDPDRLVGFYQAAFGFRRSVAAPITKGSRSDTRLQLGDQEIALLGSPHGRAYPPSVAGWNPLFQHIAIVVDDMAVTYARLCAIAGWTPISTAGPQALPASSGGVTAFKFRDPEGHPLELIAFARGAVPVQWQLRSASGCLGIDHSAISVADTANSIVFFRSLGLIQAGGSLNVGPEQAQLDGIASPAVEVTALMPAQPTPHVELLCYRGDFDRDVPVQRPNDVTATRLVFEVESQGDLATLCASHADRIATDDDSRGTTLRDPDGHLICLEAKTS